MEPEKQEQQKQPVSLTEWTLGDILDKQLIIPEYQRTYCWIDKQVNTLLSDLRDFFAESDGGDNCYVMSTVILHKHHTVDENQESYDIVDGQQRLITLALILLGIYSRKKDPSQYSDNGWKPDNCNLLKQSFGDMESETLLSLPARHVIHNMKLINCRLAEFGNIDLAKILERIRFSVIILEGDNLDLAYTFFTQTNNRGKPLSDYDLLKANHLRYLTSPSTRKQAAYVAHRWDQMIIDAEVSHRNYERTSKGTSSDHSNQKRSDMDYLGFDFESTTQVDFSLPYVRVLDLYLFRLRRWFRHEDIRDMNDPQNRRIKDEFMPAPIVESLPPFGEKFNFEECIQGGAHFFAYVDFFLQKFGSFRNTSAFGYIHAISKADDLTRNNNRRYNYFYHDVYRNVMEAHLFSYYLKFHDSYLNEAALLIARAIAHLRFNAGNANGDSIRSDHLNFKLVSLLQRSTSPTFYLGWLKQYIACLQDVNPDKGVRLSFKKLVIENSKTLEPLALKEIKDCIEYGYQSNNENSEKGKE